MLYKSHIQSHVIYCQKVLIPITNMTVTIEEYPITLSVGAAVGDGVQYCGYEQQ